MKKSRYLLIALLSMILAVILTTAAFAEDHGPVAASGKCGSSLNWTVYSDGLLEISGKGEMYNYSYGPGAPWYNYRYGLKSLIINDGITSIGDYAFSQISGFSGSITIPNTVTSIGQYAFSECSGINSLYISDSVTTINAYAFSNCGMAKAIIGDGVTTIGMGAFKNCSNLCVVSIGNSVTTIDKAAFSDCDKMMGMLVIPDSVQYIGSGAFSRCASITSITLGKNVSIIGEYSFSGCSGIKGMLVLPNSISSVGEYAFSYCNRISSAVFEGYAPDFGDNVFAGCAEGFTVYCYKNCVASFIISDEKWNGYQIIILDDIEEIVLSLDSKYYFSDDRKTLFGIPEMTSYEEFLLNFENNTIVVFDYNSKRVDERIGGAVSVSIGTGYKVVLYDNLGNYVAATTVVIAGEVDGNGSVDATDRMILARYLAGWEGYEEKIKSKEAADIDGDGDITAKDRMILARKLAGWTGYDTYFK